MPQIRKQTVYDEQKKPQTIHPQTEVAAITDMAAALDSYNEMFIQPEVDKKIGEIALTPGPPGIDGKSFVVLSRYDTLGDLKAVHPTGKAGDAYFIGPEIQNDEDRANPVYMWDVDIGDWINIGTIQGPRGFAGATNSLAIGSVSKGAVTSASITGTAPNQILNLVLEQGEQGEQGAPGDVGRTIETTFAYGGVSSALKRIGNIVMWSLNGNVGAVSGTPVIPLGYRPALNTFFYSNQSQGSNPKNVTVATNGVVSVTQALSGATAFSANWVTTDLLED